MTYSLNCLMEKKQRLRSYVAKASIPISLNPRKDPEYSSESGQCDIAICTKPLARRTRWSYGFCMRDSRFVRRRVGLSGLVKGVGESFGRSEEAIRCG